jgi:hypothetical protein
VNVAFETISRDLHAGAILVAVIPALLSVSVIQGPSWGWGNPWVGAGFGLAVLLLPMLGRRSATARYPALDPALLRIRQFRVINAASLLFATAFNGTLLANIVFLHRAWWILGAIGLASGLVLLLPQLTPRPAG